MISERAYQFYESMRIWVEVVNAYEHFQAGRIESAIGSVSMRVRVMLVASGLPWAYWGFAVRLLKKLSDTSIATVFLGFATHLGHKGYLLKELNCPRYFIAIRSVTIDRSRFPYSKPLHPDDAPWHVEDKHHHLTFERLEDHDGPIEPVTPTNIE
eukprot:1762489-Rhodomonas_salina.1